MNICDLSTSREAVVCRQFERRGNLFTFHCRESEGAVLCAILLAGNTAVVTELIFCCLSHSSICMPNIVLYTENSSLLAKFLIFINENGSC
jgi:hypothetical protein